MRGKYQPGDAVEAHGIGGWKPAVIVGEKFNGGNGGYYTVRYKNGVESVKSYQNIRPTEVP